MPNRILKESICYSDDIDKLTWFEEVVFYRLLVRCDDFGRLDARASFIKSMLFATKSGVTEKSVGEALQRLALVGLVGIYEVDGKPILSILNWSKHQRLRDSRAKYPAPPENIGLQQLAATCGNSPPESQSESQSESQTKKAKAYDYFSDFWQEYPRKEKKADAKKSWDKLKMNDELMKLVMDGLFRAIKSEAWQIDGGKFIPQPTTWINGRRWEDGQ